MLENVSEYLLNFIVKEVGNKYKIIDYNDIILAYPPSYLATKEKIEESIYILKNQGYIMVKYNDGESVCLSCTEKAFSYNNEYTTRLEKITKNENKYLGWSFFGGFIGAFLGGLITLVIYVCLGG